VGTGAVKRGKRGFEDLDREEGRKGHVSKKRDSDVKGGHPSPLGGERGISLKKRAPFDPVMGDVRVS